MSMADTVRRTPQRAPLYDFGMLAALILLCLSVGWVGSLVTMPAIEGWYASLEKPFFTPPNWLFGPAWTTLYVLMAIAAWLVWRAPTRTAFRPMGIFFFQLALNFSWSFAFFGLQNPLAGLVVIVALWFGIIWTISAFRPYSGLAALLLVPYILWVSYATALNAAIYWLN